MYHLAFIPVKFLLKSHKWIESSIKEFEEHHRWKVMTWFFGFYPYFPFNFGMSDGKFTRIVGQKGLCRMESLINYTNVENTMFPKKGVSN